MIESATFVYKCVEKNVTHVTGYKLAQMFLERGVKRNPQMFYNYMKNNLLDFEVVNGQNLIKIEVALKFIDAKIQKGWK